jgi:hypothetical protein
MSGLQLEEAPDALSHELVVLGEDNADRHGLDYGGTPYGRVSLARPVRLAALSERAAGAKSEARIHGLFKTGRAVQPTAW